MTGSPYEPREPYFPPPAEPPPPYRPPMPGNADPNYVPYSYTDPPDPAAAPDYRGRQGRSPYRPTDSPIVRVAKLLMLGCLLLVIGSIVFFSCTSMSTPSGPEGSHPTQQTR